MRGDLAQRVGSHQPDRDTLGSIPAYDKKDVQLELDITNSDKANSCDKTNFFLPFLIALIRLFTFFTILYNEFVL